MSPSSPAGVQLAQAAQVPAPAPSPHASIRLDGQASIEHQIDIHVLDLTECRDSTSEVLQGLKYCMDFRIKGGKLPHLDPQLMERLLAALLPLTGKSSGNLIRSRPTEQADVAFDLFANFLAEVAEFRGAVSLKSATDLRESLKLHRRCQPWSTPSQRDAAANVLSLLLRTFPRSLHWKELIKTSEHADAEELMREFAPRFASSPSRPAAAAAPDQLYPPPAIYFDKSPERLAEMFGTSLETGLTLSSVERLGAHYGANALPPPRKISAWYMIYKQLTDFMILILIGASILEVVVGEGRSAIVLFSVVIMNVIIGFTQEHKASKALDALTTLTVPHALVIRDGQQTSIDASLLVPGDVVIVEEGDAIPADLRLFDVSQLEVIESILTGESVPTAKSIETIRKRTRRLPLGDCKGSAFMSTVVAKGRARGIVVRTGIHTEIGKISEAISSAPIEPTNIQRKLERLGKVLVVLSVLLVGLVVLVGIAHKNDAMEMVLVGVSLAVSVIPEGLVAVVTVTMAIGVRKMAAKNVIVRQLASVESLGSVTVICSDKTGTLTEGKMGCSQMWTVADRALYTYTESTSMDPGKGTVQTATTPPTDVPRTIEAAPAALVAATMISTLCNNARVDKNPSTGAWTPIGDPTEVAMVIGAQKAGFPRHFFEDTLNIRRIGEFAFDSDRKLMSVIVRQQSTSSPTLPDMVLAKGAPEGILSRCVSFLPPMASSSSFSALLSVDPAPMTDAIIETVSERSAAMAASGLRVLALAMRAVTAAQADAICADRSTPAGAESSLTFVGLIGLIDPARPGVRESVLSCRRAGIRVVMITGDHVATAVAIATQLGILIADDTDRSRALNGYEVDSLSVQLLAELHPFPVVFARVSPDNKLRIVEALQLAGQSVAMTGDGVNDAPAIKRANVGIAMGIGGTEITKQAADIVLSDDNFSSIVDAVREGRRVFDNIKKFCVYLLSCNSAEIFLFLAATIINVPMPFTTIQVLWANIIADVPPAMSLGLEPYEADVMERVPRSQKEGVLTLITSVVILLQGIMMSSISFCIYMMSQAKYFPGYETIERQQGLCFFVLTSMQILQAFHSRSVQNSIFVTGVLGNRFLLLAFVLSFAALVFGIYTPGMNEWLGFHPINGTGWAIVGACLLIQLLIAESIKLGVRAYERRTMPATRDARGRAPQRTYSINSML